MPNYLWLSLLIVLPAVAADPPSQDFWDYMADFSDENGNLVDPLEFDQVSDQHATEQGDAAAKAESLPATGAGQVPGRTRIRGQASSASKVRGDEQ